MNKITTFFTTLCALFGFIAVTNAQCAAGEVAVTVDVITDQWGYELYWEVTPDGDACGINTIISFGNPAVGCAGGGAQTAGNGDPGAYANNTTVTEDVGCLTTSSCFTIHMIDDYGDGSCDLQFYSDGVAADLFEPIGATEAFTFCPQAAPSCLEPDQLSGLATGTDAASLSWNETGTATEWQIDYGTSGYTPPTNSTVTSNNPFSIAGLTQNTSYDFYVRAICGPGDTSEWSGPGTFTTLAAPITPDYLNAFSVVNGDAGPSFFPGELWSEASGSFADGPSGTTSSWTNDDWLNTPGDTAAKINLYFSGSNNWLISPDFDLSAGGLFLNLDAGVTTWNQTGASAMGSDDQVDLLLSPDAGVSWTSLYAWNASNTPSNAGTAMPTIDLSPFNGVVRFALLASDGTVNDAEDYDFFIDNFSISGPPCSDVSVTDTQVACNSFTWIDGNTYTPSNYLACTSIGDQTPSLFTTGPNATWTNVYTACVVGDGNNGAQQTLEINICSLPPGGANYRIIKTVANGNFFNGAAQALTLGVNTLNVAGVTFDRTVKFQFSNDAVEFDALSLNGNSVYSAAPTQLLTSAGGCDSLVTLDLTFANNSIAVTEVIAACDSYTWTDGNTYDANNYISSTTIDNETPGLFATGPNATWTNVYTACVIGDGNNGVAQTLEINIVSLPPGGANARKVKTVANGNFNNGPAIPLTLGVNTLDVAAPASPWGDRTVKFQFSDGAVEFDALSLNGGSVYSGAPQQLLTSTTGCDSLVTLDLTLSNSSSSTDEITACDFYTWIDGLEYTTSNNIATFTIPNAAGCDSTITLDLTIVNSTFSTDEITTCDNYTWIDGIEYTESNDTATFTTQNTAGCDSIVTLNLTINTVDSGVTIVDDFTLESNETSAGAIYQWLDCADNFAPITGETNATFTTATSGEYAVEVSLNGCSEISDCFTITSTVGIDDLNNTFKVELYPNPTLNSITFNIEGAEQLDVELYDLQGKLLMHQNGIINQDQMSLEALVPGSYIIRIHSEYGNRVIRVVKQ